MTPRIAAATLFVFAPVAALTELSEAAFLDALAAEEEGLDAPAALTLLQVNRARIKRAQAKREAAERAASVKIVGEVPESVFEEEDEPLALIQTGAQYKDQHTEDKVIMSVSADGTAITENAHKQQRSTG